MSLILSDLHVAIENKTIVNGVSLTVNPGELHILMGPNGSGKSTLAHAIAGKPGTIVTHGSVTLDDHELIGQSADQRARWGLFIGFQQPLEIPGVSMLNLVRLARNARARETTNTPLPTSQLIKSLRATLEQMGLDKSFASRSVNEGFSGGEKKRSELAQMVMLEPSYALLDEIDSGVDIDAMKTIADTLSTIRKTAKTGILLITHSVGLLDLLEPTQIHIFINGRIVAAGDAALAKRLEQSGFQQFVTP